MKVIKRDGREEDFALEKITDAILRAFKDVDGEITPYAELKASNIADYIYEYAENSPTLLSIEDIQDLVEKGLQSTKRKDVAKSYILYRDKRTRERNWKSELMQQVHEHINALNVQNQNANIDSYSFGGRKGEAAGTLFKQYALDYLMSWQAKYNHINNIIYTHDLDNYLVGMHNCLTLPIDPLMHDGADTRQVDIRQANSINTFCQLVAVYFQLQSLNQFGGVSAGHIDWSAVPYIRKSFAKYYKEGLFWIDHIPESEIDYEIADMLKNCTSYSIEDREYKAYSERVYFYAKAMLEKETEQAIEGLYHNLNSLQSRSGDQLPFTSLNYGTCTLHEGRLMTRKLLEGSIKGVGKFHKTSIFPCGIFVCKKDINRLPGTVNYDLFQLALRSTSQRLYPNYANGDVQMQKDWIAYDRKNKEEIINSLSKEEYEKLYNKIKLNPDLRYKLYLEISDNKILVDYEEHPEEIFSTMGCRTQNGADINAKESYRKNIQYLIEKDCFYDDVFSAALKDGRGNVCPVTIILPTIAMMAKERYEIWVRDPAPSKGSKNLTDMFLELLDDKIHEAKDQLIERYEWICSQNADSAKFMYKNHTMYGYVPSEGIRSALRHGTLALGQIGLAETLQILICCDHTTEKGMKLAEKIEDLFKTRCAEFKEEYKLNFGVYMTPKRFGLGVAQVTAC